jgi:2-polyprenyl-3-methyl-5-hydroxy-6-metoxy-1,4-benzoquinol methylase
MGEVLEHVKSPDRLMQKLHSMLNPDGRIFVSTCTNAPAIDHVYLFRHVDEIRKLLSDSGFIIENELVLPVENLPMSQVIAEKITVNYCSILKRKNL